VYEHATTMRNKMIRYIQDPDNIDNYPLYDSGNNVSGRISKRGGIIMSTDGGLDRS
jgi:hypothetical protein